MYNELELMIFIGVYSLIGLILPLIVLVLRFKKIKSIEKKKSLYGILSRDELYKRMQHLATLQRESQPVYKYRSFLGWKKEPRVTENLNELENQLFSFDWKLGWHYHLKGSLRIKQRNKSNNLLVTIDHLFLFNRYLIIIIGFFVIFLVVPLITEMSSSFLYFYCFFGPFICVFWDILSIHLVRSRVNTDEEQFLEALKEKLLSLN